MDPAYPATIAAVASIAGVVWTARNTGRVEELKSALNRQAERERRDIEAKEIVDRFRQPLVDAAFDLQSRLYNILDLKFHKYLEEGDARRETGLRTTVFRFAQYFAWTERLREEVQLLAFPEDDNTRNVSERIAEVRRTLNSDRLDGGRLMLWRDEQRALGELLIDRADGDVRVLGYAAFASRYEQVFAPWVERFEADLVDPSTAESARLKQAQHALVDLVRALDPEERQYRSADLHLAGGEILAAHVEVARLDTGARPGADD